MASAAVLKGLKTNSDQSEECATLFLQFKKHLPARSEGSIAGIVTELFGLQRALIELRKSIEDPRNESYLPVIDKDLETVSKSVTNTLRDVLKHTSVIDELRERGLHSSDKERVTYEGVWDNIAEHFADEGIRVKGCETLTARLDTYIHFLKDLKARLEGDPASRDFKDIRYRLEKLLQKQKDNFHDSLGFGHLSLGPDPPASLPKQKSWDRKRPERPERPTNERPYHPSRPPSRTRPKGKYASRRPTYDSDHGLEDLVDSSSDGYDERPGPVVDFESSNDELERPTILKPERPIYTSRPSMPSPYSPLRPNPSSIGYFQPPVPDPPYPAAPGFASPSSSAATPSLSSETASSSLQEHWLPYVFSLSRPSTSFRTIGSESAVYGDHDPGAASHLRVYYEQLLKFPFDDVDLRIFFQESDRRAKILVRQDRGSKKTIACEAVANLRIIRLESCLQLCQYGRPERRGERERRDQRDRDSGRNQVTLWTRLRFLTYERMVVFWCTFHALKAQDEFACVQHLEDTQLDGEVCLFQAKISEDGYWHALHLLRDRDSKGLRLQASALTGERKRCPVWTAFITYHVASRSWARRVERTKVHVQDLTRFVFEFREDFEPGRGLGGEHELRFKDAEGAKGFMEILRDVAEGRR